MKEDSSAERKGAGRRRGRAERGGESGVRVCLNTEGVQSGVFAGAGASERASERADQRINADGVGGPADSALIWLLATAIVPDTGPIVLVPVSVQPRYLHTGSATAGTTLLPVTLSLCRSPFRFQAGGPRYDRQLLRKYRWKKLRLPPFSPLFFPLSLFFANPLFLLFLSFLSLPLSPYLLLYHCLGVSCIFMTSRWASFAAIFSGGSYFFCTIFAAIQSVRD